jgi:membrane protein implicated in regulation of membrane protease activity
METLGKLLMAVGGVLVLVGAVLYGSRFIPWLGRLPGDIVIERPTVTIYIPLATSLVLSLVLSGIFYIISRLWR